MYVLGNERVALDAPLSVGGAPVSAPTIEQLLALPLKYAGRRPLGRLSQGLAPTRHTTLTRQGLPRLAHGSCCPRLAASADGTAPWTPAAAAVFRALLDTFQSACQFKQPVASDVLNGVAAELLRAAPSATAVAAAPDYAVEAASALMAALAESAPSTPLRARSKTRERDTRSASLATYGGTRADARTPRALPDQSGRLAAGLRTVCARRPFDAVLRWLALVVDMVADLPHTKHELAAPLMSHVASLLDARSTTTAALTATHLAGHLGHLWRVAWLPGSVRETVRMGWLRPLRFGTGARASVHQRILPLIASGRVAPGAHALRDQIATSLLKVLEGGGVAPESSALAKWAPAFEVCAASPGAFQRWPPSVY